MQHREIGHSTHWSILPKSKTFGFEVMVGGEVEKSLVVLAEVGAKVGSRLGTLVQMLVVEE